MFKKMKVYEDEKVEFYRDFHTEYIDNELKKVDAHGVSLSDHRCLYAVWKDGGDEFVLFDGKGKPIMGSSNTYDLESKIVFYRMHIRDELDILRIAETGKVPRVF